MPGHHFSAGGYRYGFNGKENDPESGTQDYGMRIYNPNLGKFLSVDPLSDKYAWNSVYAFAENRPIDGIDLDGLEHLSPIMDLADKVIPALESGNANKTLVYTMKLWRGMANSTMEGQIRGIANQVQSDYTSAKKAFSDPASEQSRQFIKEMIKHPETKMVEGFVNIGYLAYKGDPDAIGFVAGTLLQMGIVKVTTPKVSGMGDLSSYEINRIQNIVDQAGAPLDVVGSAAKGERLAPKLDIPLEKGYKSDIDYLISEEHISNYEGLAEKLPYIDVEPIYGKYNSAKGPRIQFNPGGTTISTKGTISASIIMGINANYDKVNNKEK